MKRILLSWSSGKDSAWSLHVLRQRSEYEVAGLLTTFNDEVDRVAMHAVRRALVEEQAVAADLPLWSVPLPWPCSNEQYEFLMAQTCAKAIAEGIEGIAFGDLFLEDVRAYRIKQLAVTNLEPIFPAWGIPTHSLASEMVASGLKAILTCVDSRKLKASYAGRQFDAKLLSDFASRNRPLRRKRGISQLCLCGSDVQPRNSGRRGRDRHSRSVCLCRCDSGRSKISYRSSGSCVNEPMASANAFDRGVRTAAD